VFSGRATRPTRKCSWPKPRVRRPRFLGETRSDATGSFRIALEKPSVSVALRIQPAGLPEARLSGPYVSEETATLEELHFPAAAKLSGRVTDEKGKPVAGARVEVRRNGEPGSDAVFLSRARTSSAGSWEMPGAPEGGRSQGVRADGFAPFTRYAERKGFPETVLRRSGTIHGTLLDTAGKPVSGAIVTAGGVASRTGASGEYRLTGVPAGLDDVETEWKEEFAARRQVRVTAGGDIEADLRLFRAASIVGTVVDEATRQPVAGARIAVGEMSWFDTTLARRRLRSDPRGRFRVGGLSARRYSVEAVRADISRARFPASSPRSPRESRSRSPCAGRRRSPGPSSTNKASPSPAHASRFRGTSAGAGGCG
jgi:hypothetical protein